MKIQKVDISNFRNYKKLELEFSEHINLIYGNNGSGKTNLVEAIYLLALTKSFRINNDKYLIKKGELATKLCGEVVKNSSSSTYKITISKDGKKAEIDNNRVERMSDYISRIFVIVFYPRDTELINEVPSERRKWINIEISQLYKEYVIILNNYNKIMKQRNSYLKQLYINGNASKEYLDILTKKLIEYGKLIYKYRLDFINQINDYITDIYQNIFLNGSLTVKYKSDFSKKEKDLLNSYQKLYSKEMAFGKTLLGVHHDDIEFILDGNKLKEWGSQGQIKNAILSFKLAEINIFYKIKKVYPILILDDLFSELDQSKILNILKMLNDKVQTFITMTDINYISQEIFGNSKIFYVENDFVEEIKNF